MSLEQRIELFDKLTSKGSWTKPHPLIGIKHISSYHYENLVWAAHKCLEKTFKTRLSYLDDYEKAKNITPNGLVVPKNYFILEQNILSRYFIDLMNDLGVNEHIHSWNVPLNLRVKKREFNTNYKENHLSTDYIHSDAWAGENPWCGTVMIFLMGDASRNGVKFYVPKNNFDESWLLAENYIEGQKYVKEYDEVDYTPAVGDLILSDFATVHGSYYYNGCGMRVSIDSSFAHKVPDNEKTIWRGLRLTPELYNKLGKDFIFHFPDGDEDRVDSQSGKKQPVNIKVRSLCNC